MVYQSRNMVFNPQAHIEHNKMSPLYFEIKQFQHFLFCLLTCILVYLTSRPKFVKIYVAGQIEPSG